MNNPIPTFIGPELCACGSQLAPLRCCALDPALPDPADAAGQFQQKIREAADALSRGNREAAARLALEILGEAPLANDALAVLWQIRKDEGRTAAAEALLRRILARQPNNLLATCELALALFQRGALDEALTHARNSVRLGPTHAQSHNLMGMIMTEAHRPRVGEHHYRRALMLIGPDPILLANLAWNLKGQSRMSESRGYYEESVRLNPNILQTLLGWAQMEEADRNFARALALLDQAEALAPNHPSIALARAVVHGRTKEYDQALRLLDGMTGGQPGRVLGPTELLEKGRLLDKLGRYDDAFAAYSDGKRSMRQLSGLAYMQDQAALTAERLKSFFTRPRLRLLPRAKRRESEPQPIFILGFMRSGTTLLEQSLASHPAISGGDELPFIGDIIEMMPRILASPLGYPEALADLWMGDQLEALDTLRDLYLQRARHLGIMKDGARWFTDKMPLNETHLGLIHLMFPASPIIQMVRHPLDVVLSVFSNQMTHGFFCAYDLETAARHYALIHDLVEHYRREIDLRFLQIRYEELVADQEASLRRALDFIGEPFDAKCLAFHENRRYARTASYAQVSERLYETSRFRHRHYMAHLAPVLGILEPVMDKLGYAIERTDL